ncbi:sensor histidine kinase [Tepidibacter hydrothermalis]|uniref:GHKL domain-containing protein n=1 Tax=Tepidibacter hydrothermalis TaxID=3036126 RepID=A0ABY8EAJ5_9FIRM|nr:GHKL domain-containing protein [Tepidibacter hydrothermalis]WFD09947.1 GHKL domain-containing protein [Tepidibacter hydrothermalis]
MNEMINVYDFIMTGLFSYFFIYVFKKFEGNIEKNLRLEVKYVLLITLVDFIMNIVAVKPIRLGVYYILLEVAIYYIIRKKKDNFFLSYILTFWIFQIADIGAGLFLYKSNIVPKVLTENMYFNIIIPNILVVAVSIVLCNILLKFKEINKKIISEEEKFLWVYINAFILVYMSYIYMYNDSKNMQNIITVTFVLVFFLFISYLIFMVMNKLDIEKSEKKYIQIYNNIIEESLDSMREYKHDQNNILLSIGGFLAKDDMNGLKKYFYEDICKNQKINNKKLYGLNKINNSPIKGLMSFKVSKAISNKINLNIDISDDISNFYVEDIDMCKIFGILLDNAMEASMESYEKILNIGISNKKSEINIIISNSFKNKPDINKIFDKGYSTKGENRGLGLNTVKKLSKTKYTNMCINTRIEYELFKVELILKK